MYFSSMDDWHRGCKVAIQVDLSFRRSCNWRLLTPKQKNDEVVALYCVHTRCVRTINLYYYITDIIFLEDGGRYLLSDLRLNDYLWSW